MLEARGNVWDMHADALCILTNAAVRTDGTLIMGGGVAREACKHANVGNFRLDAEWGQIVTRFGPHVFFSVVPPLERQFKWLVFFPTKLTPWEDSSLELIQRSCQELMDKMDSINRSRHEENRVQKVLLPRPGVGLGRLSWMDVKPAIQEILDDTVVVVTF